MLALKLDLIFNFFIFSFSISIIYKKNAKKKETKKRKRKNWNQEKKVEGHEEPNGQTSGPQAPFLSTHFLKLILKSIEIKSIN